MSSAVVAQPAHPTGTPVTDALADVELAFDHLLKALADDGLAHDDDTGLVGFAQDVERLRRRMAAIDHRVVAELERRNLAEAHCQGTVARLLTSILRISRAEAARRVRAAAAVGPRASMAGLPLDPVRADLAEVQRDGAVSAEQVDIVIRALERVDGRGFDPGDVAAGEQLLVGYAQVFGPEDLRRLADRVVDGIDPDGSVPAEHLNADRRNLRLTRRTTAPGTCRAG